MSQGGNIALSPPAEDLKRAESDVDQAGRSFSEEASLEEFENLTDKQKVEEAFTGMFAAAHRGIAGGYDSETPQRTFSLINAVVILTSVIDFVQDS